MEKSDFQKTEEINEECPVLLSDPGSSSEARSSIERNAEGTTTGTAMQKILIKASNHPDTTVDVPDDVLPEIQLRLPPKSCVAFRLVSRSWNSRLTDPQFKKDQFKLASQTPSFLLRTLDNSFESISLKTPSGSTPPFLVRNLTFPNGPDEFSLMGSCAGFVCLRNEEEIYVWNPTTDSIRTIPFPPDDFDTTSIDMCGIGHVSATQDYKIVVRSESLDFCLVNGGICFKKVPVLDIFSLEANSWEKKVAASFPSDPIEEKGIFSNGALHWFEYCINGQQGDRRQVIFAFDLHNEEFGEIGPPHIENNDPTKYTTLGVVMGGYLSVTAFCDHEFIQTWIMNEYGVSESWTRLFKFYVGTHPWSCRIPVFFSESCIMVIQSDWMEEWSLVMFDHREERPDDGIAVRTGQHVIGNVHNIVQYHESRDGDRWFADAS